MLALETRASMGVGVAVSVTTIPAAAYLGVALGLGKTGEAGGALGVLGANVAMLVVAASGTLIIQRALARRASPRADGRRGAGGCKVDPPSRRSGGSQRGLERRLQALEIGARRRQHPAAELDRDGAVVAEAVGARSQKPPVRPEAVVRREDRVGRLGGELRMERRLRGRQVRQVRDDEVDRSGTGSSRSP